MTRTKIFGNWRGFRRIPYNNDTAQCNVVYNNDTAQCNVVVLKRDDLALIFGDRFLYSHSVYAWNFILRGTPLSQKLLYRRPTNKHIKLQKQN